MPGYTSLADVIDQEYPEDRVTPAFEYSVAIDAFRAVNDNKFPSVGSGEVPGQPGLTFSAINQRLRARGRTGDRSGSFSLADFIDKQYPEERCGKTVAFTVANLRAVANKTYRDPSDGDRSPQ